MAYQCFHTDETALEQLIDKRGLATVVSMLAHICGEKAAHLETNWQDTQSAQWWHARARTLNTLAVKPFMQDA